MDAPKVARRSTRQPPIKYRVIDLVHGRTVVGYTDAPSPERAISNVLFRKGLGFRGDWREQYEAVEVRPLVQPTPADLEALAEDTAERQAALALPAEALLLPSFGGGCCTLLGRKIVRRRSARKARSHEAATTR